MQIYNARALCGLPVKTGATAGIHRRARSSSATVSHGTKRTGTSIFRSENEWHRENGDVGER